MHVSCYAFRVSRLFALLAFALSSVAVPAVAQSDSIVLTPPRLEVKTSSQADAELAQLRKDYDEVSLRGPRIGIGVSSALVFGAIFPLGIGLAYNRSCELEPGNPTICRDRFGTGLATLGAVAMAGALAGVIVSAVRLKRRKDERHRLRWQMHSLANAAPVTRR